MNILLVNTNSLATQKIKTMFPLADIHHCNGIHAIENTLNKIQTMNNFIYFQKNSQTNPLLTRYIEQLTRRVEMASKIINITTFENIHELNK